MEVQYDAGPEGDPLSLASADYDSCMRSARDRLSDDQLAALDAQTDAALGALAALDGAALVAAACAGVMQGESNAELAGKVLGVLGRDAFLDVLRRADQCVRRGGLATAEGPARPRRMRTAGGVFFFLARQAASKKQWRLIAYVRPCSRSARGAPPAKAARRCQSDDGELEEGEIRQ
eukprot:m51a1_g156 hypothetical protein (177) ;mRNA; f:506643-507266